MHPSPMAHAGGPAPRSASKRPMWHWLVLGGIALFGAIIITTVGGLVLWTILTRGNPQDTVDDFYTSLSTRDCDLFMSTTSEGFRQKTGLTDCATFDEAVNPEDANIHYEVTERINRSGYAIIGVRQEVHTPDMRTETVDISFLVRRESGGWLMDGIVEGDPSSLVSGG